HGRQQGAGRQIEGRPHQTETGGTLSMSRSLPARDGPFKDGRTALLLVDMQRIWLTPGADPSHPERGADHPFYQITAMQAVPNARRLLQAARDDGVEVLHTIIQSLTEDGRD